MNGVTQFLNALGGAVIGQGAIAELTVVVGIDGKWMIPPLPGLTFAPGYSQLVLLVVEGLGSCDPGSFRLTNVNITDAQV